MVVWWANIIEFNGKTIYLVIRIKRHLIDNVRLQHGLLYLQGSLILNDCICLFWYLYQLLFHNNLFY